jgi:hypothetical protein
LEVVYANHWLSRLKVVWFVDAFKAQKPIRRKGLWPLLLPLGDIHWIEAKTVSEIAT